MSRFIWRRSRGHMGVELDMDDWQTHGHKVPLLVNLQPAGRYLGEDYY
jgi:xylonate dehydratase